MKKKTTELTGAALDFSVGKALNLNVYVSRFIKAGLSNPFAFFLKKNCYSWACVDGLKFDPSTNWRYGGAIIHREKISLSYLFTLSEPEYQASSKPNIEGCGCSFGYDTNPLVAAMRCFVESKLGNEVDIPDELC